MFPSGNNKMSCLLARISIIYKKEKGEEYTIWFTQINKEICPTKIILIKIHSDTSLRASLKYGAYKANFIFNFTFSSHPSEKSFTINSS